MRGAPKQKLPLSHMPLPWNWCRVWRNKRRVSPQNVLLRHVKTRCCLSDQINHQNKKDFTECIFCILPARDFFFFCLFPFLLTTHTAVWVTHLYKWLYCPSFSATPATHSLLPFALVWCNQVRRNFREYFLSSRLLKICYDVVTWAATQMTICYTVMPFLLLAVEPTMQYYR